MKRKSNLFSYLLSHPCSKKPTCSTGTNSPCLYLFRVTPHKIAERTFMGNFTIAINCSYLVRKGNQTFNLIETFINKKNQPQNHVLYYSRQNESTMLRNSYFPMAHRWQSFLLLKEIISQTFRIKEEIWHPTFLLSFYRASEMYFYFLYFHYDIPTRQKIWNPIKWTGRITLEQGFINIYIDRRL